MIMLITPENRNNFSEILENFFSSRKSSSESNWNMGSSMHDAFDNDEAIYIIGVEDDNEVWGGLRLIPCTKNNYITASKPELICSQYTNVLEEKAWEVSRLFVNVEANLPDREKVCLDCSLFLLVAAMEFGITWGVKSLVTVFPVNITVLARLVGFPILSLGESKHIGELDIMAGLITVSDDLYAYIKDKHSINFPVLWAPLPLNQGRGA